MTEAPQPETNDEPNIITVTTPRGGVPPVIDTNTQLTAAIDSLLAGTGPIGIDTERASGYRYSQRAYLVQLYREGSGTFVIDPIPFDSLEMVSNAVADIEHIFHAASQDLPSLREARYVPKHIFDTELSARLLGYDRVGLGTVVEKLLGIHLTKAHSAADWSTRPLPSSWISYAALDVQLLPQLRDILAEELRDTGKWGYAQEEFTAVLHATPKVVPAEPWRKLSGVHGLRKPQQLAVARQLWLARDQYGRDTDIAPGRIIPDSAIIAVASSTVTTKADLAALPGFIGKKSRTELDYWFAALQEGRAATPPTIRAKQDDTALPPVKVWKHRNPEAALRFDLARDRLNALSADTAIPAENLLTPAVARRVAWLGAVSQAGVEAELRSSGARQWQIDMVAPHIAEAFAAADTQALSETSTTETPTTPSGDALPLREDLTKAHGE